MEKLLQGRFALGLCTLVLMLFVWTLPADAQSSAPVDKMLFNHMDLGVELGTEGLGVNVALPAGQYVQLRAGMTYMPRYEKQMSFQASVGEDMSADKFDKMSEMMESLTGYQLQDHIDMIARPTFWNGKILVDVFPFQKKNWFFTAGIYLGPKRAAQAYNMTESMPSLMGLSMYNNMYDKVLNEEPIFEYNGSGIELPPAICDKILSYGRVTVPMGVFTHDITDAEGHVVFAEGEEYRMVPDANGMVRADVIANLVRPYVGFGYKLPISKDQRTCFSVNAGILCWGRLKMVTHDGVDLVKDVRDIEGQMAKYVRLVSGFQVYPILNLSYSRRLF